MSNLLFADDDSDDDLFKPVKTVTPSKTQPAQKQFRQDSILVCFWYL